MQASADQGDSPNTPKQLTDRKLTFAQVERHGLSELEPITLFSERMDTKKNEATKRREHERHRE